jgi:putative transcriptional regulator
MNTAPPPVSAPTHHASDDALMSLAAGTASDPAALALDCHVALCRICAARIAGLEAIGGALLADHAPADLPEGALRSVLARLDAPPQSPQEARAAPEPPGFLARFALPAPLRRRLTHASANRWRRLAPGIDVVDLERPTREGTRVRLVAFKPGATVPLHDHAGPEHIVVFSGALVEPGTHFARGDISIREPGEAHEQHVGPDEPCVALVVNEGRLKPLTWRGRLYLLLARGG